MESTRSTVGEGNCRTATCLCTNGILEFTEQCLRVGSLLGWRFSIEQVATMLGVDADQVMSTLQLQGHLVEIEEGGSNASFTYVLHQLRLMEDTIQQLPQIAGSVADNLYATFGRTRPELLIQSSKIYGRLQRNAGVRSSCVSWRIWMRMSFT